MPVFNNALAGAAGSGGADAYKIERSLRFNKDKASYLSKTSSSSGDRKTFTLSFWIKRGAFTSNTGRAIFYAGTAGQTQNRTALLIGNAAFSGSGNSLVFGQDTGGAWTTMRETTAVFRDHSAWAHIVVAVDSTIASPASDRIKIYINGVLQTSFATSNDPAQNHEFFINNDGDYYIGRDLGGYVANLDGLLAEFHLIDGQQLAATDFGEFDEDTGVWNPIEFTGNHNPTTGVDYSSMTVSSNGGWHADPYGVDSGFNGIVGSGSGGYAQAANGTANPNSITFTPTGGIAYTSNVQVWLINNANTVSVNGGAAQSIAGLQWVTVATGPGTLTSLKFERASTNGASFGGIRVDGVDLVNVQGNYNGFHLPFSPDTSLTHPNKYATQGNSGTPPSDATSLTYSTGNYLATNQGVTYDAGSVRKFWVQPGSADPSVKTSNDGTTWTTVFDGSVTWNDPIEVNCRYVYMSSSGSDFGIYYDQEAYAADASGSDNHWLPKNLQGLSTTNGNYLANLSISEGTATYYGQTRDEYLQSFNGSTSGAWDFARNSTANVTGKIDFPGGRTVNSSLELWIGESWSISGYGTYQKFVSINGGAFTEIGSSSTNSGDAVSTWRTFSVPGGTLNSIEVRTATSYGGGWGRGFANAIRIDGEILTDHSLRLDDDVSKDSPTNYEADTGNNGGNYCVLNPLDHVGATFADGNLKVNLSNGNHIACGSMGMPYAPGKYYWEVTVNTAGSAVPVMIGMANVDRELTDRMFQEEGWYYYGANGQAYHSGSGSNMGDSYGAGDVIGIAVDCGFGTQSITFYKNGVSQGTPYSHSHYNWYNDIVVPVINNPNSGGNINVICNFGARPFNYTPPTGYKPLCTKDLNDPDVKDSSAAFDAKLWTGNGGEQIIGSGIRYSDYVTGDIDPSYPATRAFRNVTNLVGVRTTTANGATIVFQPPSPIAFSNSFKIWAARDGTHSGTSFTVTHAGGTTDFTSSVVTSTTQTAVDLAQISGVTSPITKITVVSGGPNPRFSGIEVDGSMLIDSTADPMNFSPDFVWIKARSASYSSQLYDTIRDVQKALVSNTNAAEATYSSGLTAFNSDNFKLGNDGGVNGGNGTYVGWAWDAGSSTVSNTDGTITSQVRANQTAGFSVVKFSGPSSAGFQSVGHGLNKKPEFIICKDLDNTRNWSVYHKESQISDVRVVPLNQSVAAFNSSTATWDISEIGTSTFTPYFRDDYGASYNADNIAYCFAPVAGFSHFGSWEGNSSSDGPFIYTGFSPRWIMYKWIDGAGEWAIRDTARSTYNVSDQVVTADGNGQEQDNAVWNVDILSNGFKIRTSSAGSNSSSTFIFAAFAESPLKYARAR